MNPTTSKTNRGLQPSGVLQYLPILKALGKCRPTGRPLTRKAQGTLEVMAIIAASALAILWIAPTAIRSINAYFQTTESAMKDSSQEELLEAPTINIETTCQSSNACGGTDEGKNCLTSNGDDCKAGFRCYFQKCIINGKEEYDQNHCDLDATCDQIKIGKCGGNGSDINGKVIQCDEKVAILNITTALGTFNRCAGPGEKLNGVDANAACINYCTSRMATSEAWCPGSPEGKTQGQPVTYVTKEEDCSTCPDNCCAYCKQPDTGLIASADRTACVCSDPKANFIDKKCSIPVPIITCKMNRPHAKNWIDVVVCYDHTGVWMPGGICEIDHPHTGYWCEYFLNSSMIRRKANKNPTVYKGVTYSRGKYGATDGFHSFYQICSQQ